MAALARVCVCVLGLWRCNPALHAKLCQVLTAGSDLAVGLSGQVAPCARTNRKSALRPGRKLAVWPMGNEVRGRLEQVGEAGVAIASDDISVGTEQRKSIDVPEETLRERSRY